MQSHAKRFARIESDWTFREGDSSLISNISCPKQSNLLLHFLRTENCLSRSFGTVERLSLKCLPMEEDIFAFNHALSASAYNLHNLHQTSHIGIGKLHTVGLQWAVFSHEL